MMLKTYIEAFTLAAKAHGIGHLNFYTDISRSRAVSVYQGELDKLELSEACRLFIEGEVDGFSGEIYVENFASEQIEEQIQILRESALAYQRPFVSRPLTDMPGQETQQDFLPLDKVLEGMLAAERAANADSRTQLQGCFFQEKYSDVTLTNGEGCTMTDRMGGAHSYLSLTARQEELVQLAGKSVPLPWGQFPDMEAMADRVAADALARLHAGSYPTGACPVVLAANVVCELLDAFAPAFFAKNVYSHMSVLEGKLDQQVAGENITLLEDPLLPGGLRPRRFDDEGTPTSAKTIVERGTLRTYLHNRKSAADAGCAPGGNGFRPSVSEEASAGYTNLLLQSGEKSQDGLLADMGDGLLITGVSGVFAGAHPSSGEFSLISHGYKIRQGVRQGAVSQITIAGSFFEMLRQVQGIGGDNEWMRASHGCVRAPSLYVSNLAVSGGADDEKK